MQEIRKKQKKKKNVDIFFILANKFHNSGILKASRNKTNRKKNT